ncbi:MAG: hypothetical protein HKL90_15620 [Elusimicrobia bacterium]|nr:hypothetical protein [Elusimicrobiota bacterium]
MSAPPAITKLFRQPIFWLLLATALVYSPLIAAGFVYDDWWMIPRNPAIRGIHLLRYFLDPATLADPAAGFAGDVYRPLTTLSFAVDFKMWALRPGFYHLENILLHLANGYLLWRLLGLWLKNKAEALLATALFLLHPVQVEAVSWIGQRTNLLSTFALLGALHYFVGAGGSPRRRWIIGGCCYAVALLCRESAVVLPVLVALVDAQGWRPKTDGRAGRTILYGELILITAAYLGLRFFIMRHWSQFSEAVPPWWQSSGLGVLAFSTYLGKTIFPMALRPSYDYPEFNVWFITGAYGVALGYLGLVWGVRRKNPLLFTGLAWFLACLLPVLQLIPIRAFVSERFLYVPMMGAALAAVWAYRRYPSARTPLWAGTAVLAVVTAANVPHWRNERSLWAHAVKQEPTNAFAHACYAAVVGNPVEAERQYRLALINRPNPAVSLASTVNLSAIYLNRNEPAKAAIFARQALRREPTNIVVLFDLCRAYTALRRKTQAARYCGELERLAPNSPQAAAFRPS